MGGASVPSLLAAADDSNLAVPARVGADRIGYFLADGSSHDRDRRAVLGGGNRYSALDDKQHSCLVRDGHRAAACGVAVGRVPAKPSARDCSPLNRQVSNLT